jgi:homoserine dehydrogenase
MSGKTWRIGVAGLGTVGGGLLEILNERPDFAPAEGRAVVTGVSARTRSRARSVDISKMAWFGDPVALAGSPDNDIFVELIGGSDGSAKAAVETALKAGKPVVTANKALLAEHGLELAMLAETHGVPLLFEAAVMGGVPAVKVVREALVGDTLNSIAGILNGTCNYILTEMEAGGRTFADVLAEAQAKGYAEADPTMDVGGFDAGHKITLLASLAFGCGPNFAVAQIEGISEVELSDIHLAHDLGYRIKLIAQAVRDADGVSIRVRPTLVPLDHPLAQADGALNALFIEGRRTGRIFLRGPGAGAGPTATAVAADIADVMTGAVRPVFSALAAGLKPLQAVDAAHRFGKAFVRLLVKDQPGVIAAVSETLAECGVSIDAFLQKSVADAGAATIVLITHPVADAALDEAMARIENLPAVVQRPRILRVARI